MIAHPPSVRCLLSSGSGFPHSEIPGSKPVRGSPKLIAAYHVLHRLSAPRHPPDTLKTLDCSHCQRAPFGSPRGFILRLPQSSANSTRQSTDPTLVQGSGGV